MTTQYTLKLTIKINLKTLRSHSLNGKDVLLLLLLLLLNQGSTGAISDPHNPKKETHLRFLIHLFKHVEKRVRVTNYTKSIKDTLTVAPTQESAWPSGLRRQT